MAIFLQKEIIMNNQQNIILNAIEMAATWDINDENLCHVIQSHAELLAGNTTDSSEPDFNFH
tara:strand:- start:4517 stop:4702 length:186 start_codon:yes stop_codon:yes gene_type:complete